MSPLPERRWTTEETPRLRVLHTAHSTYLVLDRASSVTDSPDLRDVPGIAAVLIFPFTVDLDDEDDEEEATPEIKWTPEGRSLEAQNGWLLAQKIRQLVEDRTDLTIGGLVRTYLVNSLEAFDSTAQRPEYPETNPMTEELTEAKRQTRVHRTLGRDLASAVRLVIGRATNEDGGIEDLTARKELLAAVNKWDQGVTW